MSFIDTIFAKLRRHPKRIVFPDGDDPRVVRACHAFYEKKVGIPVLIGNREVIERVARAEKVSLDHVAIVNPETSSDLPVFCERFEKIDRYKKTGARDTRSLMTNPNYYAAMMLQFGQVDALVGGVNSYSGSLLRPLIQLVKQLPHSPFISGCLVAEVPDKKIGDDGVLFLADCGVVPDPERRAACLHRGADWPRGAAGLRNAPTHCHAKLFHQGQRENPLHRKGGTRRRHCARARGPARGGNRCGRRDAS